VVAPDPATPAPETTSLAPSSTPRSAAPASTAVVASLAPASTGPSPAAPSTPAASSGPTVDLASRLPRWAAGEYLEPRDFTTAELLDVPKSPFGGVLDRVGKPPGSLEVAAATGSEVELFVIRVRGLSAEELSDSWVATIGDLYPTTTVAERTAAGHLVRRLRVTEAGQTSDEHVWTDGDVMFSLLSQHDRTAAVDDLIAYLARPPLESIFPATLAGQKGQGFSIQGAAIGPGGDVCAIICPGEPQAVAAAFGVRVEDVDVAVWGAGKTIAASAFRVVTPPGHDLIDARVALLAQTGQGERTDVELGGKSVTRFAQGHGIGDAELLYATGNVLVVVREPQPERSTGRLAPGVADQLDELFRALP
jgi:hypothetical protein